MVMKALKYSETGQATGFNIYKEQDNQG